jgi:hypothetical protein
MQRVLPALAIALLAAGGVAFGQFSMGSALAQPAPIGEHGSMHDGSMHDGSMHDGPMHGGPGRPDPFGDATVSRADARAKADAEFARLDTDHDGVLSQDEFSAQFPEDSRMRMMAPMMMTRLDENGDARLSKAEFTGFALKRFDMADANHDGQLTKAERDSARDAMRARFRDHGPGRGGPDQGGPDQGGPDHGGPDHGGPGSDDGPPPPPPGGDDGGPPPPGE